MVTLITDSSCDNHADTDSNFTDSTFTDSEEVRQHKTTTQNVSVS